MYYQNYEDYIRSILGYPVQNNMGCSLGYNTDQTNTYSNANIEYLTSMPRYSNEILDLYPEIYKIVNPMVCKICEANTKPITSELIEQMTDEIYLNLESDTNIDDEIINIRVNLPNSEAEANRNRQVQKNAQNTSGNTSKRIRDNRQDNSSKNRVEETANATSQPREDRQIRRRNNTLRDLIKILILNQLLGGRRPQRPPRPFPPPRPPFPGGPRPNPRPPIMPRDTYNDNLI